jgi:hypothetical protein
MEERVMFKSRIFWLIMGIICLIGALVTAGEASNLLEKMFSGKQVDSIAEVQDKEIVKAFYSISNSGKIEKLNPELFQKKYSSLIDKDCIAFKRLYIGFSKSPVSYSDESNEIVSKYIATAKARNDIVRLYKPAMGKMIHKLFRDPYVTGHRQGEGIFHTIYKNDRALIEFDTSGRIVSFMTRVNAIPDTGDNVFQYTAIYMGIRNGRHLENKIPNSTFQENLIKEY